MKPSKPRKSKRHKIQNVDTSAALSLVKKAGLSLRQLAFQIDKHPSALSLLFRGYRKLDTDEIKPLADALQTTPRAVMDAFGIDAGPFDGHVKMHTVPVVGFLDEGWVLRHPDYGKGLMGPRRALCAFQEKGVEAARIQKPGATIDGGLVFFTPMTQLEASHVDRLNLVKILDTGSIVMGLLTRGMERNQFELRDFTGQFVLEGSIRVESVAVVVGMTL